MRHITFRTDASINIGTGHVMRCLTLADALREEGANCEFICREHSGHLNEYIRSKGYVVHGLPIFSETDTDLTHSHWLGATQMQDAQVCTPTLNRIKPDWLVVDHYALDARWESLLAPYYHRLMAIDDLADRPHACQLLLDQTFGRATEDYRAWVPNDCTLLCGSRYALLRPEFAALREYSLQRRVNPKIKHLLITMGGMDKDNLTSKVLTALRGCPLPQECVITVVMGAPAPWLTDVQQQAQIMPWPTTVVVGANNMAQLMADSDLAIGAAGATAWERCCLGLPTMMMVLAENQSAVACNLVTAGAVKIIEPKDNLIQQISTLLPRLIMNQNELIDMITSSARIVDGSGATAVIAQMEI